MRSKDTILMNGVELLLSPVIFLLEFERHKLVQLLWIGPSS